MDPALYFVPRPAAVGVVLSGKRGRVRPRRRALRLATVEADGEAATVVSSHSFGLSAATVDDADGESTRRVFLLGDRSDAWASSPMDAIRCTRGDAA